MSTALPELPDIETYLAALDNKLTGRRLEVVRIGSPFLVRSVAPPVSALTAATVTNLRRIGKRIAIRVDNGCWAVLHLMIAGRLHWKDKPPSIGGKQQLAAFDFEHGSLLLTEAGTKKRASLYVVADEAGLSVHDPGGQEPLTCSFGEFAAAMRRENHTLKRALTDPRLLAGIGNAYSDEVLHAARMSPVQLTHALDDKAMRRLFAATTDTLAAWRDRLLEEAGGEMPARVTAFREDMAVHGRFGQPCPHCGEPVQRIRFKDRETNYCARCQTDSRLLRDRSLSRLLKKDWPKTLEGR